MLGLNHIIIIAAVSLICYFIFFRKNIINKKIENFNSDNINYHQGNDYNVVSYDDALDNINNNASHIDNNNASHIDNQDN